MHFTTFHSIDVYEPHSTIHYLVSRTKSNASDDNLDFNYDTLQPAFSTFLLLNEFVIFS